jgi:hypothetical protein
LQGDSEVSNAARLHDSAVEALILSLERLNQFIVHGIVPDDLKKPRSKDRPAQAFETRVTCRRNAAPPDQPETQAGTRPRITQSPAFLNFQRQGKS